MYINTKIEAKIAQEICKERGLSYSASEFYKRDLSVVFFHPTHADERDAAAAIARAVAEYRMQKSADRQRTVRTKAEDLIENIKDPAAARHAKIDAIMAACIPIPADFVDAAIGALDLDAYTVYGASAFVRARWRMQGGA